MKLYQKVIVSGITFAVAGGVLAAPALAVTSADVDSARSQLTSLGQEMETAQQNLQTQSDQLELTRYQIETKQSEIDEKQTELQAAQTTLAARTRSDYKSGSSSLIDVILQSSNFEDLVSSIYYIGKVNEQDAAQIQSVKDIRDELTADQQALQDQETTQQEAVDAAQAEADEYQSKVAEAQSYYEQLDSEVQAQLAAEAASQTQQNALTTAVQASTTDTTAATTNTTDNGTNADTNTNTSGGTDSGSSDGGSSSNNSGSSSSAGGGVDTAYSVIGCPYVYGATGPSSFDCSGLVCYCFGYGRGRTTYDMIASLKASGDWKTSMSELSYGDLVFPSTGHVGIYIGNGMMIHAPHPGASVCVASVYSFYGGGSY